MGKLIEITALVSYSIVVYADSEEDAAEHVSTWEESWAANADLIGVCDVDILDVREGIPEEAHEDISNAIATTTDL